MRRNVHQPLGHTHTSKITAIHVPRSCCFCATADKNRHITKLTCVLGGGRGAGGGVAAARRRRRGATAHRRAAATSSCRQRRADDGRVRQRAGSPSGGDAESILPLSGWVHCLQDAMPGIAADGACQSDAIARLSRSVGAPERSDSTSSSRGMLQACAVSRCNAV